MSGSSSKRARSSTGSRGSHGTHGPECILFSFDTTKDVGTMHSTLTMRVVCVCVGLVAQLT